MMTIYFNLLRVLEAIKVAPSLDAIVASKLWETPDIVAVSQEWEASGWAEV